MTPGADVSEMLAFGSSDSVILTDDAVPEPIGSRRNGNAFGANGQLEDLADDDPACGSPGAGNASAKLIP